MLALVTGLPTSARAFQRSGATISVILISSATFGQTIHNGICSKHSLFRYLLPHARSCV
jgi:hypothetical protein